MMTWHSVTMSQQPSPYTNIPTREWQSVTQRLLDIHPLSEHEIVDIVLSTWQSIFASKLGAHGFSIGEDIFPKPQILGFLLHTLIPLELAAREPGQWRSDNSNIDKDCVYIPDDEYSFEIKTSSHKNRIFGNRSYAQRDKMAKKRADGYFLTINFEKIEEPSEAASEGSDSTKRKPRINLIRFGWIDAEDWRGQKSSSGQQASLPPEVYAGKLKMLYQA